MSFTVVACAFIDQQHPQPGQICTVKVHDANTNKHKYRMRFVAAPRSTSMEADAIITAKEGSKIPDNVGELLINELGEDCIVAVV